MGTTDSNGIYQYDGTDQVSPIHTLLNLGQASVSARIQATPKIVANISARTAYATGKTVNATNPLLVWRADAAVGRKLEYSINGTDWFYYTDSADDTGWTDVAIASGFVAQSGLVPQVRRIGSTVYYRGGWSNSGMSAANTYTVGTVPSGFRPSGTYYGLMVSNNVTASGARLAITTAGVITIGTGSTLGSYYLGNQSWLVD